MVRSVKHKNPPRPFIGWDGEGHRIFVCHPDGTVVNTHHYMLFGCSNGELITGISLGTRECLELVLYVAEQNPGAHHVGFSFEYDVNMILKDLEWRHLAVLTDIGQVKWNGFRIKHIPHKMLTVSKGGVTATIYDTFGFFHSSYMRALKKYKIGTAEQLKIIEDGKGNRGLFTFNVTVHLLSATTYCSAAHDAVHRSGSLCPSILAHNLLVQKKSIRVER